MPQQGRASRSCSAFDRQELKVSLTRGVLEAVLLLEERAMEDLWNNFRKLTKRSVKRRALPVQFVSNRLTIPRDLIRAYESWMATARRQKFSRIRAWPTIEPVLRHSVDSGAGQVLATFLDDRLLASVFVTHIGEISSYVYGGYMDGAENDRPTHVLQYVAIQEAIERGMTTYTFGERTSTMDRGRSVQAGLSGEPSAEFGHDYVGAQARMPPPHRMDKRHGRR